MTARPPRETRRTTLDDIEPAGTRRHLSDHPPVPAIWR